MPRLPYLNKGDIPGFPDLPRSKNNISRAVCHSPRAAQVQGALSMYFRQQSKLDPRLRELAILQVGYVTKSAYEYAHHCALSLDCGATEADILSVADETAGKPTHFDPLTKAVLCAARQMSLEIDLSDEIFAVLRRYLDDELLMDLLMVIANYNSVVRLLSALRIDLEEEYEGFLDKFPLSS
ncbi:carboxymuconolactone decarboxylase family protein [Afipia sp. GAS231]|uniref:carboxymuconolactone decarboxylase family protein n=1 Tax=Afipia sp. GAS231 TaxID=1882747 RepID=UPI0008795B7A|nr:carboxymuconolactone decarboxylase family protein [Afipia sp. GAS231]SDO52611.1 Alkylhydroperoxidase family enzyme, contains CxxC motif [Afipia sp. GAS231]